MHAEAYAFVAAAVRDHDARGPVYEIGSRNINGSVRDLFRERDYWGVDLVDGPDVDIVADAATYWPPIVPQTVICCEVLEHTESARAIVQQAACVLEAGGLLILTAAGPGRAPHSASDGGPMRPGEFYRNCSATELVQWAGDAGVTALATETRDHDVYYLGRKRP